MKVKDLTDILSKCNPNAEIFIYCYRGPDDRSTYLIDSINQTEVLFCDPAAIPVVVTINIKQEK